MINLFKNKNLAGFTLIELIVVVSLMTVIFGLLSIDLNSQRSIRSLRIAENELVSNIRKVQSYTLSSRILPNGEAAQYYILKFDLSNPSQYKIQAIYNVDSSPQYLLDVETISLPQNIKFNSGFVTINRSNAPTTQNPNCSLLIFSAPFGKILTNDGCVGPASANAYAIQSSDDYKKIFDFVNNTDCGPGAPSVCSVSSDAKFNIRLSNESGSLQKNITVNAVTNTINFD